MKNTKSHALNVLVSVDANAASLPPSQSHATSLKKNSASLKIGFRDLLFQRKTVPLAMPTTTVDNSHNAKIIHTERDFPKDL